MTEEEWRLYRQAGGGEPRRWARGSRESCMTEYEAALPYGPQARWELRRYEVRQVGDAIPLPSREEQQHTDFDAMP